MPREADVDTGKQPEADSVARAVVDDLITAGEGYLTAKDGLLAHYRGDSVPREAFWRRYEEAKKRWAEAVENAS